MISFNLEEIIKKHKNLTNILSFYFHERDSRTVHSLQGQSAGWDKDA